MPLLMWMCFLFMQVQWPADAALGATTLNVGMINGGQAANAVPDYAEAVRSQPVLSR